MGALDFAPTQARRHSPMAARRRSDSLWLKWRRCRPRAVVALEGAGECTRAKPNRARPCGPVRSVSVARTLLGLGERLHVAGWNDCAIFLLARARALRRRARQLS